MESSKSAEGKFHPVACDLRQEDQILSMFDVINSQHGGLDVCINNAGLGKMSSLMTGTTEDWNEQWQVGWHLTLCTPSPHVILYIYHELKCVTWVQMVNRMHFLTIKS